MGDHETISRDHFSRPREPFDSGSVRIYFEKLGAYSSYRFDPGVDKALPPVAVWERFP